MQRRNGKRKKRIDITKDAAMVQRTVLAAFYADGSPSYRSARKVADELGLTPQSVSALLQAGWNRRLFSIGVRIDAELAEQLQLEDALRVSYGLKHVFLVPTSADIEDLGRQEHRRVRDQIVRAMAARVAEYLDALVNDRIGQWREAMRAGRGFAPLVLGVGRGTHMRALADHLRCSQRLPRLSAFEVWPIIGTTGGLDPHREDASPIASDVAHGYGGTAGQLPCPAFVPPTEAALVVQPRPVRQVMLRIRGCDVVVAGLGAVSERSEDTEGGCLASDPTLNAELLRVAGQMGAVGHVSSFLFDAYGRSPTIPYAAVGLGFDGLRQMVKDGRQVVLVAGADERTVAPLQVALHTGLASVIVSETATARRLMGHR